MTEGWEAKAAYDGPNIIGFRVRWSEPNPKGEYLYVRHYIAGEDGDPSVAWCLNAAEGDAQRLNQEDRRPQDYHCYREWIKSGEDMLPKCDAQISVINRDEVDANITTINNAFGSGNRNQQRIAELGLKWIATLLRKNADYGSSVFKSPKLKPSLSPGDAILVRASDKIERLSNLMDKGQGEIDESIEDTMSDLGSYCLLYLARPKQ